MPRTIHIAAALPASPDELFDMYLDPELHAAITGAPASIGARAGAEFSAFDGGLEGKILQGEVHASNSSTPMSRTTTLPA